MKSIFDKNTYEEFLLRINKITPATKPLWGKMNAAQMMAHCAVACGMATGLEKVKDGSNFLKRLFFKGYILSNKPFRKELPTAAEFIMTNEKDFEHEKQRLIYALTAAHKNGPNGQWSHHALVGTLTGEEWGRVTYKHVNHHLEQFGV